MKPLASLLLMLLAIGLAAEDEDSSLPPGTRPTSKGGLSAQLSSRLLFPRPQAPLPITATMANDGDTPRSGQLHLTLVDGNEVLYSWQSPEWTLTRSPRTVDVLLPPLPVDESHGEIEARMEWREGAAHTAFDPMSLSGAGREERPLTVALVASAGIDGRSLLRSASLERFLAVPGDAEWKPDARTVPVRLSDAELPTHPLAYCAYDEVVLAGAGIAHLKEKQLAALERWVRAGGSVYVVPEGPLGEDAAAFLKRLGADDGETLVDARGKLVETGEWPRLMRPGLGRAAVAPIEAALDPARAAAFDALPGHLWKLRAEPARLARAGKGCDFDALGKLDKDGREREQNGAYYRTQRLRSGQERPSFLHTRQPLSGTLTNLLLPSHVTIIPFSVVLLVFAAFVLIVGPGDWFVLGWLRARRFTWVVFPLVAIAFTLLMVRLSRHYLGATDHRQRLEVVDCGAGGEVLRASAIELVFSGHRGEVASDLHDALWADLGRGDTESRYGGYAQQRMTQEVDAAPVYDGSVPGRYLVAQQVGQWDPRLRRSLSFEAPPGLPLRLDRQLRIDDLPAYAEELSRARSQLYVAYWRGGSMVVVHGSLDDLGERGRERGWGGQGDWLTPLCCHPQLGWFTLASQVSPAGGATFEDFSVHDASDPDQWLLVVAERKDDQVWVMRRLYRGNGKGQP
jgi:hypothetical protein